MPNITSFKPDFQNPRYVHLLTIYSQKNDYHAKLIAGQGNNFLIPSPSLAGITVILRQIVLLAQVPHLYRLPSYPVTYLI